MLKTNYGVTILQIKTKQRCRKQPMINKIPQNRQLIWNITDKYIKYWNSCNYIVHGQKNVEKYNTLHLKCTTLYYYIYYQDLFNYQSRFRVHIIHKQGQLKYQSNNSNTKVYENERNSPWKHVSLISKLNSLKINTVINFRQFKYLNKQI